MNLHETKIGEQKAILVSVDTGNFDSNASLNELIELAKSAGATVITSIQQKRSKPDTATFVGSGVLEQIKEFCQANSIDVIIFDCELSPSQIRNIENYTDTRTIDRTMLILDIFALNAKSKEGNLQVELAQLKYMLPRLTGKGIAMSRLGGGIGTRGPGETKLETDRRHIRYRIENLKEQLSSLESRRKMLREKRIKDGIITVAIVGYTNAGKSTLMNTLTDAGVLSQDKLFATLDPTSRALKLPCGMTVMLIDTVGFVRRLPHHLIEAFKSTLEEAAFADIILNVCDISSEESDVHLQVTKQLLNELGYKNKPIISVLNKCDLINCDNLVTTKNTVKICAKDGSGIDNLLLCIENNLPIRYKQTTFLFPFNAAGNIRLIHDSYDIISEEYTDDGVLITAIVDEIIIGKLKKYII